MRALQIGFPEKQTLRSFITDWDGINTSRKGEEVGTGRAKAVWGTEAELAVRDILHWAELNEFLYSLNNEPLDVGHTPNSRTLAEAAH